jgi:uncharacterized membrane protein YcaP (DUF421 family)
MGKRQIGQLQPFELAITIMISELASVPMQNTSIPLINGIIPILTLLSLQLLISFSSTKSYSFEKIICGKPTILIENGKINMENLKKELYTLNDLLEQLRLKNMSNLCDVEFAVLETNGEVSIVAKSSKKTPSLSDMNIPSKYEGLSLPVIIDGKILKENLSYLKIDTKDFDTILTENKISNIENIIFGSIDNSGKLYFQYR